MATQREQQIILKVDTWLKLEGLPTYSAITAAIKEHKAHLIEHAKQHAVLGDSWGFLTSPEECLECKLARVAENLA